jgi:N-acetylglutamate synthase-like GNAT family acetyltransferase
MKAEKPRVIDVTVGKAQPEEIDAAIGIYRQHLSQVLGSRYFEVIADCNNTYVARNKSLGVVGAVTVEKNRLHTEGKSDWVELKFVGVESDLRGSSVGRQLISQVTEEMKKEGFHRIIVKVYPAKSNLVGFFHKMGFKMEENDLVTMKLEV